MKTRKERDELLWEAIESGTLDDSLTADTEVAADFAAHQKLESLFAMLREGDIGAASMDEVLTHPSQISRYHVRQVIGEGAFGKVYLAHDPQLDRLVAIKLPSKRSFSSDEAATRFLEEARLAASLKHPAIVTVYDAGSDEQSCFIVMEYVEGRSLDRVLRDHKYDFSQIVELIAEVADALHHAHKHGFVHRDLKPGNILVDARGHPHVADFGLAVSESSQLAKVGQVAGTPAYMSPEQVRGETHRLDGRTDIWSLGVVLYELLTGRHPFFKGDSVDCFDEILHREPKPPRQINDEIPADLESICLQCLSKDVTDRFSTAADLAHALRDSVPSSSATTLPFVQRHYAWWILPGVISVLVMVGIVILSNLPAENEKMMTPEADTAKQPFDGGVLDNRPEIAGLLQLVYDETLDGSSPSAWIQIETAEHTGATTGWHPLTNGAYLSSGDRYRIVLRAPEQTYFYVFQIDTGGRVDWVFPQNSASRYSTGSNPVPANTTVKVPENKGMAFFLDENTGIEHVYVVATRQRWKSLEKKLAGMSRNGASSDTAETQVDAPIGLRLRGIGGFAPDDSGSPSTMGIRGVLAKEVWFHHVNPDTSRDSKRENVGAAKSIVSADPLVQQPMTSLFDGESLAGWQITEGQWVMEKGVIQPSGRGNHKLMCLRSIPIPATVVFDFQIGALMDGTKSFGVVDTNGDRWQLDFAWSEAVRVRRKDQYQKHHFPVRRGQWYRVVIAFDGENSTVLIDGERVLTEEWNPEPPCAVYLYSEGPQAKYKNLQVTSVR